MRWAITASAIILGAVCPTEAAPKEAGTWGLTRQPTSAELADGLDLQFDGRVKIKIRTAVLADFRLEQVRPVSRWIPLGAGPRSQGEFTPPDGSTTGVRLHIRCVDAQKLHLTHSAERGSVERYVQAPLRAGGDYRLIWTCRPLDGKPLTRTCEFAIPSGGPGLPEAKQSPLPEKFYRVEILYRRRESKGVLFLGQRYLPSLATKPNFETAAIGYTAAGKHVDPPNPSFERLQRLRVEMLHVDGWKQNHLPRALTTRTHGATLRRGAINIRVTDLGAVMTRPTQAGLPTYQVFCDALFRAEIQAANFKPLRQSNVYWKTRIQEIATEIANRRDVDAEVREWARKNLIDPCAMNGP